MMKPEKHLVGLPSVGPGGTGGWPGASAMKAGLTPGGLDGDEWADAYGDYPSNEEREADMRADGLDVDGWTLADN